MRLGRGQATLRLSARGSDIAARWVPLQHAAEERWRAKVGVDRTARLRGALESTVSALPLEHPHYPASYGAADASITGGDGQDWKPVPREGGDTVSQLPLSALISEALVAFAMDYEEKSPVALSLSATVIKRIPPQGRPLREIGNPVGISALERHGFVRVVGDKGSETATLTPKGHAVSEAYRERVREVESDWRDRFGDETVTSLRRALADVVQGT